MKKLYGSQSRRYKEALEFFEKIELEDETLEILLNKQKKLQEIEIEKQKTAKLFVESNLKQNLLKEYINKINKKIFDGSTVIDNNIEKKAEEIEKSIETLQSKMQTVFKYTKSEMAHQISQKFSDAEKKQKAKMLSKIEEGNDLIKNLNNTRLELEQMKIEFEEINSKCDSYIAENDKLKIRLGDLESDFNNLNKKLTEITEENKNLKKKYQSFINKEGEDSKNHSMQDFGNNIGNNGNKYDKQVSNNDSNNSQASSNPKKIVSNLESSINNSKSDNEDEEEEKNIKSNILSNKNNVEENNKNNNNLDYTPNKLILILKESIKAFHRDINELNVRITDEKKEKNEATQLLQKCIDDMNTEIKYLSRTSLLPNIKNEKNNSSTNNNNNNNHLYIINNKNNNNDKLEELESKLTILSYIYDNIFQKTKNKNLFFVDKTKYFNKTTTNGFKNNFKKFYQ